jgi:large subunit ribosomal protein L22
MTATADFYARHRYARITSRKARRIADEIRGRSVNHALQVLEFAPQRAAAFYLKVLKSAVANASLDENVNLNRLYISECRADDGPLLNDRMRWRPGPQGRAMPYRKRTSHLIVGVSELDGTDPSTQAAKDAAREAKRPRGKAPEKVEAAPEEKAAEKKAGKKKTSKKASEKDTGS